MPIAPDTELRRSEVDPTTLPLQPHEFYVLSQIQDPIDCAALKTRCIGVEDFHGSLARLISLGAVVSSADPPQPEPAPEAGGGAVASQPLEPPRDSAPSETTTEAVVEAAAVSTSTGATQAGTAPGRSTEGGSGAVEALPAPTGLPDVEPVPADDPRVEPDIALSVDFQRCVLAALDSEASLNAFRVLGIGPTEDERRIKRAFHALSRKLHPDAYFGQQLGSYARRLEKLFTLAKSSFTTLKDREARDVAMSEWFQEESKKHDVEEQQRARDHEYELARQKSAERERARRNLDRSRQRARKRASTNLENRDSQVEALRTQAHRELDQGRAGEALAVLHRAKSMARPGSELAEMIAADMKKIGKKRGKDAYMRAIQARKKQRSKEAAALFDEAASLLPSLEYLTEAAIAMASHNSGKAREHGMAALGELAKRQREGGISAAVAGRAQYAAAVAFRSAGLLTSARESAKKAEDYLGDTPDVRALLKSLSVP